MQFTQRQRPFRGKWRPFAAAILVGLLLGFLGPFGSYPAYPTATRYAFWLGLTMAGAAAAVAADAVLPASRLRPGAVRIGVLALVSALPMTFVVAWTLSLLQPGRVFAPQQLPALFAAVAAVQLLVVYATTIVARSDGRAEAPRLAPPLPEPAESAIPAAFPPALLSKLPPGIGRDIIALETEDHYLRVHAAGGSALILMRMADAVALLDPRLGAQVHRRWWVAQTAVAGGRTEGGKAVPQTDRRDPGARRQDLRRGRQGKVRLRRRHPAARPVLTPFTLCRRRVKPGRGGRLAPGGTSLWTASSVYVMFSSWISAHPSSPAASRAGADQVRAASSAKMRDIVNFMNFTGHPAPGRTA